MKLMLILRNLDQGRVPGKKDDKWLHRNHVTLTQMVWQPVKTITLVDLFIVGVF